MRDGADTGLHDTEVPEVPFDFVFVRTVGHVEPCGRRARSHKCPGQLEIGVPPHMPVALVQQGTTHMQRVYAGTLSDILEVVERDPPEPPTLIIVGEVVKLKDKLSWFEAPTHSDQGATTPVVPGS